MKKLNRFSVSKNQIRIFTIILFFVLLMVSKISYSSSLTGTQATGSNSTNSTSFTTVGTASITVDVTNKNYILLAVTFYCELTSADAIARYGSFRIADSSDPDNINSGMFQRSLSSIKTSDHGIGSVVYIFDVRGLSGNRTYVFQHCINNPSKTLTTNSTIVAIPLTDGSNYLNSNVKTCSEVNMGDSWDEVTGSLTNAITLPSNGGFYVSASIQSRKIDGTDDAIGEWKLQYRKSLSGTWTDIGYSVQRSMSNTFDNGLISLVASLPDNTSADDYYFRVVHKRYSGTSTIQTVKCNIIAVELGVSGGYYFPVFSASKPTTSTTSTSLSNAIPLGIKPQTNTGLFIHSQFGMSASGTSNYPIFDLYVDNTIYDGMDYRRYLSSSSDRGSGAAIGLASNLVSGTAYTLSLRHASTSGITLTTSNALVTGFGLDLSSAPLSPVTVTATSGSVSGSYNTLKGAFDAINAGTHQGAVSININANTTETATATLNASGSGSASYTSVNIQPAGGAARTISGSVSSALITFSAASNVTIDGLNSGGNSLTFYNSNTSAKVINMQGTSTSAYSTNNIITNCTILSDNTSSSNSLIYLSSYVSNVTISNCTIKANSTNFSPYLIYSYGNSTYLNNNITINNNLLCDFANATVVGNAAVSLTYTKASTVTNNKIYQTSSRTFTVTSSDNYYYGIYIHDGAGHTVSNNTIGYASSDGTGTMSLSFAKTSYFYGIFFTTDSTYASTISNNIISGININGNSYSHSFYGIFVDGTYKGGASTDNMTRNMTVSGNTIGSSTDPNSIQISTTGRIDLKVMHLGDYSSSLQYIFNITYSNNSIGGINTSTVTPSSCYANIISGSGKSATVTYSGNTVGYASSPIVLGNVATANTILFTGINMAYSCSSSYNITGNTISYITNYSTGTSYETSGIYNNQYGITATKTISNNTIRNLTSNGGIYGVYFSYSNIQNTTISGNKIYNLNAGKTCAGVHYPSYNSTIESNFIYRLKTNDAASSIYGLRLSNSSGIITSKNNLILLGQDENGNDLANLILYGIYDGGYVNHYFNTVLITGTGTSGTNSSYSFYRSSNNYSTNIRDNIFANYRSNSGGTGTHYAIRLYSNSSLTINNNDYYAPNTGGVLGYLSSNKTTLDLWKTATGQDANSLNTNPSFVNLGGTVIYDYLPSTSLPGVTISGITTDLQGALRSSIPTMGAMEGYVWKGTVSNDFANPNNWLAGNIPNTGSAVIFDSNPLNDCILDGNRTVGSIMNGQSTYKLVLNGYQLDVKGSIDFSNGAKIDAETNNPIIVFSGSTAQSISSGVFTNDIVYSMLINNASGVTTSGNFTISNTITMTSGTLSLGNSILTVNGTIILNNPTTSYFKTNGTGYLKQSIDNSVSKIYPIGVSTYNPVTITNNTGTADDFSLRVFDALYDGGLSGNVVSVNSINRTWDILKTNANGGSGVDMTFQWNSSDELTGFTRTAASVFHYEETAWVKKSGTLSAAGSNPYMLTYTGYTGSFSPFGIGNYNFVMPVTLSGFNCNVYQNNVKLNWQTNAEQNNSHFDIERKAEGTEWKKVGNVKGIGNSNTVQKYSYCDNKLSAGKYSYRLKQVDFNGNYEYHNLTENVLVSTPKKFELSQNYPNPFNPKTKIDFQLPYDMKVSVIVYDITGREVKTLVNNEYRKADYYTIDFNATQLASGTYFYRIIADKYIETKKMVMVK